MSVYAQDYGYFFNSENSDRTYSASAFETWLLPFFAPGVFYDCFEVTELDTPDMAVNVSGGYANLNGCVGYFPTSNTLTIDVAHGVYARYDAIVLRRDNINRRITMEVVKGEASANPSQYHPQRDSDIYECVVALVKVNAGATKIYQTNIYDRRLYANYCGYVITAVQTPDFEDLYTQFTASFMEWFDEMKDQLDEDAAGHLQLEIDDINSGIDSLEDGLAIVVDGDSTTHTGGAAVGSYVLLKNSSISGCPDGAYTAAKVIPANTAIDSTYLTAVSDGIANALNSRASANNYDTAVDLTAYSTASLYTAASDGYVTLRTTAQGGIATVNLYDAVESTNMLSRVKQQDSTAQGMSIYVKKGMKMYGAATGSATSKFIPLK